MTLVSYRDSIARNIQQPVQSESVQKAGAGFLPWKEVQVSGGNVLGAILVDMTDTFKNTGTTTSASASANTDVNDVFLSEVQIGDIAGSKEQPVMRSHTLTRKGGEIIEQQVYDSTLVAYPRATAATIAAATSVTITAQMLIPVGGVAAAAIRLKKPAFSTVYSSSKVTENSPGATYTYYGIPVDVMDRFEFEENLSDVLPKGSPSILTQQPASMTPQKAVLYQAAGGTNPITEIRATAKSRIVAFADDIGVLQFGQKFGQRATLFSDQINVTPGGDRLSTFNVTLSTSSSIYSAWIGITEESPGSLPPQPKAQPPAPAPKVGPRPMAGGLKSYLGRKVA